MEADRWDKLVAHYHDEIVSPFYGKVENPLYDALKAIPDKKEKEVAEFGCGLFYLGETLSNSFKKVHASDFSAEMVKKAKEKHSHRRNVEIIQEDIRKIPYHKKFKVLICVNALLMPSLKDVMLSLKNFHRALKPSGQCLLILPSMESILYHCLLLYERELKEKDEATALRIAKRRAERTKYDFFTGHFTEDGDTQKFFYKHEIEHLMKRAGFTNVEIKKVIYPWGNDISGFEDFPAEEGLWDWFVEARK
ncbi:class I SAM-dependent methyltransferase [Candidatus Woesearchaeota archaeon]|nr:class I SAM-dependent methyltransferase [Candidatus Woesearchaeota archaeon]